MAVSSSKTNIVLPFTRLWSQRGQKNLVNSVLWQYLLLMKKRRKLNRCNAIDCFKSWCDFLCCCSNCRFWYYATWISVAFYSSEFHAHIILISKCRHVLYCRYMNTRCVHVHVRVQTCTVYAANKIWRSSKVSWE